MKNSKKIHPIYGTDILCASKSEQGVGNGLVHYGYRFIHDKKYPYDNVDLRFDFMLLNSKEDENNINKDSHHVFIEVKDDDSHYIDDLQEKQRIITEHEDVLVIISDKNAVYLKEKVDYAIYIKNIIAERNALKYENIKLKNILKQNKITF